MLQVVCVCTGAQYSVEYVLRLRAGVESNLTGPYTFTCVTDSQVTAFALPSDIRVVNIASYNLPGWWAKMALFLPEVRGGMDGPALYFDLDTVIAGDLDPLARAAFALPFSTCANFTQIRQRRQNQAVTWPCRYGSCVMTFPARYGVDVYKGFEAYSGSWMEKAGRYGDQAVIEALVPDAELLQDHLPRGFFLHYKDLTDAQPDAARVVVFGGRNKPHNTKTAWVQRLWR